jgi:hypothetical protein
MKYKAFMIEGYRGIIEPVVVSLKETSLIPMIGINESGKTSILQAIYCFDQANDLEYKGRHLENLINLYSTTENAKCSITAEIEVTKTEIKELVDELVDEKESELATEEEKQQLKSKANNVKNHLCLLCADGLKICRDLAADDMPYNVVGFQSEDFPELADLIVSNLPYILYNDDFIDRPPSYIDIPKDEPEQPSDWLAIYEKVFAACAEPHSIFKVAQEPDARRVESIISDVEEELNNRLSKAWKTFNLEKHGDMSIRLRFVPSATAGLKRLRVQVVEKIGKKERFFDIIDRSKGFLWFYNFVMKLEFNPKVAGSKKDTIYLLDEPGSYLHPAAQEKLCAKLKDISQKEGVVMFCTHTHHLLNPEYIPLNSIYIVEKDKTKNIKATPLPQVKPTQKNQSAYQPLYEAMQVPALNFIKPDKTVVCVEGIYDKYALELFINKDNKFYFYPGRNAHSIQHALQLLICFGVPRLALWDNDEEGNKEYQRAIKAFGSVESEKFCLLPLLDKTKRRMETMFEDNDVMMMRRELGLNGEASYESILSTLFFAPTKRKDSILSKIENATVEKFKILRKIIDEKSDL